MNKIIVVGVNHAGTAAINTILDHYPNSQVVAFDRNDNISFLGCGMALWIGKQIGGPEGLFYSSKETLTKKGATVYMETTITNIDFDKKIVYAKSKNGTTYEENYDKLILATGSQPIIPNLPGIDLENVQQVKLYQDAQDVIQKLNNESLTNITVVGAGYIGVELAEAFARCGKNVTLVDVATTSLSTYYDQEFTTRMDQTLKNLGITLAYGEKVVELRGNKKVESIVTDKSTYDTDMVIMAVGFKPNTTLGANDLTLFRNNAYLVNTHQQTSNPDVYAIGDCATVKDNAIGDTNYIALATNAVRSGIVAAHNVCKTALESIGVQGSNGISINGLNMVSTGITETKAKALGINVASTSFEDYQKPGFIEHNNEKVLLKIVYNKDTRVIIGVQMASKLDISLGLHVFSLAIQEKVTIEKMQ
ncbi:MAG: H2O-forming NADH oxidase, partial [Lachnospiraceae bacterium]